MGKGMRGLVTPPSPGEMQTNRVLSDSLHLCAAHWCHRPRAVCHVRVP